MSCKTCELSSHRQKNEIPKRHCKRCMSSYYMEQAEKYLEQNLTQDTIDPYTLKAKNYDDVRKAVGREIRLFTKRKTYLADDILNSSIMKELIDKPNIIKANRVIESDLEIDNLSKISCIVKNKDNGNSYTVTLNSCTCPDYNKRKRPCKHMYRLAMAIGLIDPPRKVKKK